MKINDEQIKKIIEQNPVAFGTVSDNHFPNVIPVAHVKIISRSQLIITDNYMHQTIKNLKHINNVCLAVWDKKWNGYKFIGKAEYFTTGKWKKFVEKMPENKNMPRKGAIVVTINKIIKLK